MNKEFTSLQRISDSNYQINYIAYTEHDAIADFEADCIKKDVYWGILCHCNSATVVATYNKMNGGLKTFKQFEFIM